MLPILVVEDDGDINNLVATILRRENYVVEQAFSGTEAKRLIDAQPFSLLLLDLMLPGMTGEELIAYLRQTSTIPVIILSAKDTGADKVNLLRLGADDYVTKPFDSDELVARVEAVLRRANTTQDSTLQNKVLTFKEITLDSETHLVTLQGNPISLTAREFSILELMLQNPKKVFTKSNLYESVWNDEFFGDDNTINVHISNLRTKLQDKDIIQTVWGIGFKLQE